LQLSLRTAEVHGANDRSIPMEGGAMRTTYLILTFLSLFALCAQEVQAQTPAPVPERMPFDIPYGGPITLERAKEVAAAALTEAKRRDWKMAVAIVEPTGVLVYYEKMDGTQYASAEVAPGKARASARYRRATKVFMDLVNGGQPYVMSLDGVVASEGGLPLVADGKLIGAIGVSGGTSAQDGVVAKAGADTVK
jgi:uncharacterized protein GlcG (DUF336 family)